MERRFEDEFFKEYEVGAVSACIYIFKAKYIDSLFSDEELQTAWIEENETSIKERLNDFIFYRDVSSMDLLINEIKNNFLILGEKERKIYADSILEHFRYLSDFLYPEMTANKLIDKEIQRLVLDTTKKDIKLNISQLNSIKEQNKRLATKIKSNNLRDLKNPYFVRVFGQFLVLLNEFAERFDLVLMKFSIDLFSLQKESGVFLTEERQNKKLIPLAGTPERLEKLLDNISLPLEEPEEQIQALADLLSDSAKGKEKEIYNCIYKAYKNEEKQKKKVNKNFLLLCVIMALEDKGYFYLEESRSQLHKRMTNIFNGLDIGTERGFNQQFSNKYKRKPEERDKETKINVYKIFNELP